VVNLEKETKNGILHFGFNENELIRYLEDFKAKCENGEIENTEDIADFVML